MKNKYVLNKNTGTLHIVGKCHYVAEKSDFNLAFFETEDDAVNHSGRYMKNCKTCFKNRDKQS